jgi:Domain of unknown function (DUF222)
MAPRDAEDDRTITQRRADALVELVQLALATGELPETGGERPRLTFLVTAPAPASAPAPAELAGLAAGLADVTGAVTGCGPGVGFARTNHLFPGPEGDGEGGPDQDVGLAGLWTPEGFLPVGTAGPNAGLTEHTLLSVAGFGDGITDTSAQLIGTHTLIPAETIARIGCDADHNIAILNPAGEVMNYGRSRRSHSRGQRRAVIIRDQRCVFPGCDVPPVRCLIHHVKFWTLHQGPTDLDNLALVCPFHHHRVHEHGWQLHREPTPAGPILWIATAPDGHQLRQDRRAAA